MIVAALTGGIASGKTTVARMFGEQTAWVVDLDELSRLVVEPHKPAWQDIVACFGKTILRQDGTLDRNRLGRIVFADPTKRKRLEQIVHPRVLDEYRKQLKEIREKSEQAIVIADVPLLMEIEMQCQFEKVIVVYLPPESQIKRLVQRDGLSEQAALDRLKSQMPIDEKVGLADFVIDNRGSIEETRRQVEEVYQALKMLEEGRKEGQRIKDKGERTRE